MPRVINTLGMGTYGSTWQHAGYSGAGNVENIVNSLRGRPAVVCGNANGVFDELTFALHELDNPVIYGVNDVGMYLPQMDHWMSLHVDNLKAWKHVRWLTSRSQERAKYHSIEETTWTDYSWEGLCPVFALSGYFAMQVAHIMGAGLIVLCGCPGSQVRRFFDCTPREEGYGGSESSGDQAIREQLVNETKRVPELMEKVRSLSGWTKDYFGGL